MFLGYEFIGLYLLIFQIPNFFLQKMCKNIKKENKNKPLSFQ